MPGLVERYRKTGKIGRTSTLARARAKVRIVVATRFGPESRRPGWTPGPAHGGCVYRPSLSGKVAFAQLAQMIVFSAALFLILGTTARLFDQAAVISDRLSPAVEDLGRAESQLVSIMDLLESGAAGDASRAEAILHRDRPFRGLATAAETLASLAEDPDQARELKVRLQRAHDILVAPVSPGDKSPLDSESVINSIRSRMDAAAGDPVAVLSAATELRRAIHPVRLAAGHAAREATLAKKDADREMTFQRSRLWTSILVMSIGALVLAVLFLLLAIRAMKPIGDIAIAVKRLAAGDLSPVRVDGSREIADTADALNQMAAALSARRAAEAVEKEREVRTERLAVVGRMASAVAHEIRNPLNSISLNVDLLADMIEEPGKYGEKGRQVIHAVQREVDRLNEITEDYLQFGRMPKAMIGPCNVTTMARETCAFMAREFEERRVSVTIDSFDDGVKAMSDEGQLRQALVNILRNSIEAMPDGGAITISVQPVRGDRVNLSVTDTGPGISQAQMGRLFEPFATTKPGGTGLGLAFVQQVVTESGGAVDVRSAEGRGTTVNMVLVRDGGRA